VEVRRSLSSRIPAEIVDGNLELGVISFDPHDERLLAKVIFTDKLAFVVWPGHALAQREQIVLADLAGETFIAHNVVSPYREAVVREFQRQGVPLNMPVEMPTVETIRRLVQAQLGVAFLPTMCVEQDLEAGSLVAVNVKEMQMERKIYLLRPSKRVLSYAAAAFMDLLG